jgi:hypothetical protein
MATIEYKKLVMAGPMRWVVLTTDGQVTTLAWFVTLILRKIPVFLFGCAKMLGFYSLLAGL